MTVAKPNLKQRCTYGWADAVITVLRLSGQSGMSMSELTHSTGLSAHRCELGLRLAIGLGQVVDYRRTARLGGSRWWAVAYQDARLAYGSQAQRQVRVAADRNHGQRRRARRDAEHDAQDAALPTQITVAASACVIAKPGPASAWELASWLHAASQ